MSLQRIGRIAGRLFLVGIATAGMSTVSRAQDWEELVKHLSVRFDHRDADGKIYYTINVGDGAAYTKLASDCARGIQWRSYRNVLENGQSGREMWNPKAHRYICDKYQR